MPKAVRTGLVTGVFTLVAIGNSYPLVLGLDSSIGRHGDAWFSVWRLAWVAHQIRHDPGRLFHANIFYPEPNTLAYSDAMLLPALAVAPLHWRGISPLLIYNLTLLAAFVASGLAAYALVRYLSGSTAAGVCGGLIFGFAPHRMEHFDHLELQFAFWIPLAALAWHRAVEHDQTTGALKVGALAAAQVLSSIYHGIFLMAWLALMTAVWHLRAPRRAIRLGLVSLLPPLIVLAVYSVPYLATRRALGERELGEVAAYSARPVDFLSAPPTNVLYGGTAEWATNERFLFPGAMAVALALVGLWRAPNPHVRVHGAGLVLGVVLTLGLNTAVYGWLYDFVLPFRGLRVPARASIIILLGLAVLSGAGLARVLSRATSRVAAGASAALLVGTIAAEYWTRPDLTAMSSRPSGWYALLRAQPDAVVFEWPVDVPWRLEWMQDVHYMFRSIQHWRPLLNGYSGKYPTSYLDLLFEMRSFPYTPALRYLRSRGATVLVVHEYEWSRPRYDEAIERLHRDPLVQLIGQDRDAGSRVAFFKLLPEPPPAN